MSWFNPCLQHPALRVKMHPICSLATIKEEVRTAAAWRPSLGAWDVEACPVRLMHGGAYVLAQLSHISIAPTSEKLQYAGLANHCQVLRVHAQHLTDPAGLTSIGVGHSIGIRHSTQPCSCTSTKATLSACSSHKLLHTKASST
jgi:hypothetical protein